MSSDLVYCTTLRNANTRRQKEWDTGGNIDLSYAGNELAGEVSEAIDAAVRLIDGGNLTSEGADASDLRELADELADVVICIDLIGLRVNVPQIVASVFPCAVFTAQDWVNELGSDLKGVCNTIKKLERERHGMKGSRASLDDLQEGMEAVVADAYLIAAEYVIDLDGAVARKFNATSEKVGLNTRYMPWGESGVCQADAA